LLVLLARSRIDPSKLVIIVAHVESPVGRIMIDAGVPVPPGRSSVVIPTSRETASLYTDVFEQAEVRELAEKHGATAILVFDQEGNVGITFERFPPASSVPEQPARDAP
jgi:hypothetical protein